MKLPTARHYPQWLLGLVVLESVLVFGAGGIVLALMNVLSGPLTPERWARVGGLWLGLPMLATLFLIVGGHRLICRDLPKLGTAITLLPLVSLILFILWANI